MKRLVVMRLVLCYKNFFHDNLKQLVKCHHNELKFFNKIFSKQIFVQDDKNVTICFYIFNRTSKKLSQKIVTNRSL